jgi:hypothetical protein
MAPVPSQTALRLPQVLGVATALALLALAAGLFLLPPWAVGFWPWLAGPSTFYFLSSIAAGIAAPLLWVALAGEWGAMTGSGLFPFVTSAGVAQFLWRRGASAESELATLAAAGALFSLAMVFTGRRIPLRDARRAPPLVRFSFALFAVVLVLAGGALALGRAGVLPWPIAREPGVVCGWIFLGAAAGYVFGFLRPAWHNARGPLLGFLVYDLILLPPLLSHFAKVKPEHRTSLWLYVAVLVYSGLLALYALFVDPATRRWGVVAPRAAA